MELGLEGRVAVVIGASKRGTFNPKGRLQPKGAAGTRRERMSSTGTM